MFSTTLAKCRKSILHSKRVVDSDRSLMNGHDFVWNMPVSRLGCIFRFLLFGFLSGYYSTVDSVVEFEVPNVGGEDAALASVGRMFCVPISGGTFI